MSAAYPTNLKRKLPYITVSARGLSNGLSSIPNDGADFGPDTLLGATAPNQYGPPYTQTTGIAEAISYAESVAYYDTIYNEYEFPRIQLGTGLFYINEATTITTQKDIHSIVISGSGQNNTRLIATQGVGNSQYAITLDIPHLDLLQINDMSWYFENSASLGMFYWVANDPAAGLNLMNIENGVPSQQYLAYFGGLEIAHVSNIQNEGATPLYTYTTASVSLEGGWGSGLGGIFECAGGGTVYVARAAGAIINGDFYMVTAVDSRLTINQIASDGVITVVGLSWAITLNTNVNILNIIGETPYNTPAIQSGSSTVYNINMLTIDGVNFTGNAGPLLSNVTANYVKIGLVNNSSSIPFNNTTNGTTAGTVTMQTTEFMPNYKKYIITFNGYENDTTTNQTINFPKPFSSYAVITGNNTGLTISASTSGITITSPNSTATYSGIVIVEGY